MPAKKPAKKSAKKQLPSGYERKARQMAQSRHTGYPSGRTYLTDSYVTMGQDDTGAVMNSFNGYVTYKPLDTYRTTQAKKRKPKNAR